MDPQKSLKSEVSQTTAGATEADIDQQERPETSRHRIFE